MAKNSYGLERTIYSWWVEKALLFANWSSFSRQMPSPYVSNSCGFSLNSGEGGGDLALNVTFRITYNEMFLVSVTDCLLLV